MSDDIPTFEQLQSPFGHLSFEERTGEPFEPKLVGRVVDVGESTLYGKIEVTEHTNTEQTDFEYSEV